MTRMTNSVLQTFFCILFYIIIYILYYYYLYYYYFIIIYKYLKTFKVYRRTSQSERCILVM
jgi:hypothetical protein